MLGIGTVAVHSNADAGAAFVKEADLAVRLGYAGVEHTLVHDTLRAIAGEKAGILKPGVPCATGAPCPSPKSPIKSWCPEAFRPLVG